MTFSTICCHVMVPSAYRRPHSRQIIRPPMKMPAMAPVIIVAVVWRTTEPISSCLIIALAAAISAGVISRPPRILFRSLSSKIPLSAVDAPPRLLGMTCDQSLSLRKRAVSRGPPALICAGIVSQTAFACSRFFQSPPAR